MIDKIKRFAVHCQHTMLPAKHLKFCDELISDFQDYMKATEGYISEMQMNNDQLYYELTLCKRRLERLRQLNDSMLADDEKEHKEISTGMRFYRQFWGIN